MIVEKIKDVMNRTGMRFAGNMLPLAVLMIGVYSLPAKAADRSGKEVFDTVCVACHASGKEGAPKIGDREAWRKRASHGLEQLTQDAITGLRKMPAHGGQGSLTDLEISRAVAYMVSDGAAADPDRPYSSPKTLSGEQVVQARCQECHASGKNGAPRLDDWEAWKPRLKNGIESLVKSATNGHNSMPSRGGMASLSDAEMHAAVEYMISQAGGKAVGR
jgi:cytochrome c5